MRRHPLICFFVLLLLATGLFIFLNKQHSLKVKNSSAAQSASASQSSIVHAVSTNAVKATAKVAAAGTNKFAWRLSNTTKPIKQLVHDPHAILLENAFIDTSAKLNLSIPKSLQSQGDPGAYIVQARGPIDAAFRYLLAGAGATVESYIPNNAYLVRATSAIANGLAANPLVQSVIPYEPYYKVQSRLLAMADTQLPPEVQLNLGLFPDDAQDTIKQIRQQGGIILSQQDSPAGYTIVKIEPPKDWTAVAQLPGVHVVEGFHRRATANDLARPALGVSSDSITPTNYMNLYGSNVIVEVNDTGIDTNHPDFKGTGPLRVFFNDPAEGVDTDGHGTHVAGIIAGDGTESTTVTNASGSIMPGTNGQFRGKAPFAQMFSMNFEDDDATLQQTAATNGALISNNSWDFGDDFDYDLEAASYDAATRDALPFVTASQPVAFVFSAGNQGNTAGSILSPATAKDLITVGALEELRFITNQVTNADGTVSQPWLGETDNSDAVPDFSSCGNVGIGTEGTFGRFKPDVVAPGTFVVSCRSSEWDTDAYYNPTNDTVFDFPDFIPTNSVSVAPFQFFVPSNAVEVIFSVTTNVDSPVPASLLPTIPIPFYLVTNNPNPGFGFIGSNFVEIAPAPSTLGLDWTIEASNTITIPLAYDLIVQVLTTNDVGNYYQVLSNLNQNLGTSPPFYRYESGTSMSAAAISGFLALIQDYFTNQFYQPFTPSPALLKVMTINGARATAGYDFQVNNSINFEGWGLPNLSNSIPQGITNLPAPNNVNTPGPPCSVFFRDQSPTNALATGDSETFIVNLNTNDVTPAEFLPLRVSVAWTDPPGDPVAALKLVNSLELVVTDLDNPSIVYYGNDIGAGQVFNTVEASNTPPIVDAINNVQNIFIQPFTLTQDNPDANYSVTVIGGRVNVNAVSQQTNNTVQDFALVISSGEGEFSNAMEITDGGIISNPTGDQNITDGQTNTVLLNQIAGANTPLLGTNTLPFTTNTVGIGANGQFTIGMTNQWHFYVISNTTSFSNAAFIAFGGITLSIPRMGVFANSDANSTVPGADLDILMTADQTDPNASNLLILDPVEVSNALNGVVGDSASLAAGGTGFVVYSNAVPATPPHIFYVGIKSENHMAVDYGFVPIFTDVPFSQLDANGNEYLSGLNVPVPIPDGTPSHPGLAFVFSLALTPIELQNVVVTNVILHQNFGNLVGSLTHNGSTVVLNSHDSLPNPPGPYTLIYDDSGQGDIPNSQPSDGPGSLRNYEATQGQGIWQMTQEGTALGQTGEVVNTSIFLQKYQNPSLNSGVTTTIQPTNWFYTFIDVPNGVTNLQLFGTNIATIPTPPPLQMFLNTGSNPTLTNFLFEADLTNSYVPVPYPSGPNPGNEISDGPPLQPGLYFIGVFNPSAVPETVFLLAALNGPSTPPQPALFTSTNIAPILNDGVTNTSIFISNTNTIESANVGIVVQYPRISDLAFTLVGPRGQRILLMEQRGGPTSTNAGGVFFITNSLVNVTANGSSEPNTNFINTGQTSGTLTIVYNMFTVPDEMTVYYGTNPATFNNTSGDLILDTGLTNGIGTNTITFGPGASTYITVIMNQFGNTNGSGDAWTYSVGGVEQDFNYLTFTGDTNLTTTPIKFAIPPFDLRDLGTNFVFGDLDLATNGDYFGQTNIFDAFGGWNVPTNFVSQVITNTLVTNNYNLVSVVSNSSVAFSGTNYLALGYGIIQRTNSVIPFRLFSLTYAYRGPGIAGWWRGEGNANDSSDAEGRGQNGAVIGRVAYPAGEVSQSFGMMNNGQTYDFAGTNGYVQIRQQPSYQQATIINGTNENGSGSVSTNFAIVQTSPLDVGMGPGFTVEGWINPTNTQNQQPLVEWLARVPTNGSDTNLIIRAGPFLDRGTDHYYYLLGATNWPTSETWAEQLGGHLATVDSADEQNWIFDTFAAYGGRNRNLWIGLTNFAIGELASQFGYVDGVTNISYTNWLTIQPTNCDGTKNFTFILGSTNHYAGLWKLADGNGVACDFTTNLIYGVVEVTNLQTNGVQFWISVTNVPGTTNIIMTNTGCLFANLMDTTNGSHWIYSAPGLIQSNVFQHVALTYDTNSGEAMLFYAGTNVASTNWGGGFTPNTSGDVLLGKDMSLETNNFFGGEMDEMSIYSRALSDAEILGIYSVSAYTTNRLIGKFDPSVTPPLGLAEAQLVVGNMTNTILGENDTWQQGTLTFIPQTNALTIQIQGIQPGMLFDSFGVSEAPLGNLYYQPEQPLDELKGENAFGQWTLEIWDTRNNALATDVNILSWQLQFIMQTNQLPPVSVGGQEPTAITILPGQTVALAISVPSWALGAQNSLISSTQPLNVFFNQTNQPVGASPPDIYMFGPATSGSELLTTTSVATNIIPGQTYYIGLQNTGSQAASAVFEVDFNVAPLTNAIPVTDSLTNGALRYFSFEVSTNDPYEATFQLLHLTGNADLVVSKGPPLPTLTSSAYGSFNSGRANENIYVLTNSTPVPLSPGTWYLGVFNRDTNTVNYTVLAQELDLPPVSGPTTNMTLIPLTNGVPFNFTAGPGAALTNFFYFDVTNAVTTVGTTNVTNFVGSIHFELYNMTGNGDLTVQTNAPPFAPPFFQSSQQPGTIPELIRITTNSVLTNLIARWYLGVPNETTNLINYTIIAVIDTNNYFPAFPGAEGAGAGALGASIRNGFTNNTVYHVINLDDSGTGSLRAAVSSTNRTIIFDLSGVIYLQSPLIITNSYLTIAGQTAPEGGITVAGAPMIVSTNTHDIVIRYLRLRPLYSGQNLFEADWGSGNILKITPNGTKSTFASGLSNPNALTFDSAGNLFGAEYGNGNIDKFTPAGVKTLYVNLPDQPNKPAFDSAGDLFVAGQTSTIYKIPPGGGSYTTFATGLNKAWGLAFNSSGTLFASSTDGHIYEYQPGGLRGTFVSGLSNGPFGLAFNRDGNLFAALLGTGSPILKITPTGSQSTFVTGNGYFGIAFDNAGNLYAANGGPGNTIFKITPNGTTTTFASGLSDPNDMALGPPASGNGAVGFGDGLQFITVSNVIADHISALWSSNNDLSILNSTNVTVQWSILSDSVFQTNLPSPNGVQVRYGAGTVSLHHNLFADNATGSPRLGDNISLDFVNNVIYNWATNAGYSAAADLTNNPAGFTNYLNYICNYLIAGSNTITTNIAFWGGTNTTWIFQTNNFIDDRTNNFLNGANTKWNMFTNWNGFTNLYTETNQFRFPPVQVDEAYMAYEKVLDFAGVSMFDREPAETNIVENVRRQTGTIINTPGVVPTLSTNLIFVNSAQDGIPDFWKVTFGQIPTNSYNNFALDSSGYSELEEFDNWLAGLHAVTGTNTPVAIDLSKLFGKTGNLSFCLTNPVNGTVYLTNVLGSVTNTSQYSNNFAIFTPTHDYSGFASFDVFVTNNDTVAYFGPETVSVFVGSTQPTYSQFIGILLPDPVTNNIGGNTIQWYQVNVPTNAVASTNTLVFAGAPMNLWYSTNFPPTTIFPGDFELLTAVTNGVAILNTNSINTNNLPVLVPGGTYYLGVQNTNNITTNYAIGLDFDTVGATPLTGGSPQTNTVPAGEAIYYAITVPPTAIGATNILDFVMGGSVNLWFNQTVLPTSGGPGDYELLNNVSGNTPFIGNPILTLGSTPPLVPNATYYLEVDNTGGATPVTFAIEVDFEYSPPVLPVITNLYAVAGTTFTVTNTATDTNSGTLFYSLTTLPPVGATIDTSGVITWNVPANEPATNILFTTVVSNSFTTQTATNSFTVTVIPLLLGNQPQTNTIPAGTITWLAVDVPTNAIWATNILSAATAPLNIWFANTLPPMTNEALMVGVANGISVLGQATVPTNIVPGSTYYIGVDNTANVTPTTYHFEVDFALAYATSAPFSETLPATAVTGTNAQLNGFATANANPATAWFEWGVNTNYSFTNAPIGLTGGNNVQYVTNSISGLLANQVYHYRLDVSNALGVAHGEDQLLGVSGVAVWGQNIGGITNVPLSLSNEVAIAAEMEDGVALNSQGRVTVWGDNTFGQTNVPASLTNVANIAAGNGFYALAVQNGKVTGWGDNSGGQISVPAGLSNVVAIAAGQTHGLALKNDGTVVAWGANGYGQTTVPAGLSNVVEIAAGSVNSLALLNNGTVVAWGGGETNSGIYPDFGQSVVPPGLTNVVAISSYGYSTTALKSDGTVVAWGENNFGQTMVPGGLNDVAAIANGLYHALAVQETGRAIGWGSDIYGETNIPAALTNIYAIAGGNYFSMALESPLSINLNVSPIVGGSPETNIVSANSVVYYSVSVPANAIAASNLLSFATANLNVWFNQTNLPQPANPPDTLLISGTRGTNVLTTNGTPPLLPAQTYYLAIQNTNASAESYVFGVNFSLTAIINPTNPPVTISGIVYTNIGGSSGFLLTWYAPTNDTFQVQETPGFQPVAWATFTNIITYSGPMVSTNGLFTFFDNGSEYPFGPIRFYRLLLLSSGVGGPPVLPAIPNQAAGAGTTLSVTNTATDFSPGTLAYTLTTSPSVTNATISSTGVITWAIPTNQSPGTILFTTIVTNSLTTLSATNSFTVNVLPSSPIFFTIIHTNISGINGFLLSWRAPTNDTFQVEETPTLQPVVWNTFSNIITYTGGLTPTNGLFTFFDNGSQYPFGPQRAYRPMLLLQQASQNTLSLQAQSNKVISVSQPLTVTNIATDSNTGAVLHYTMSQFPPPATNAIISPTSGIITWVPGPSDMSGAFKFTTFVTDNGTPQAAASNSFTVFVPPGPAIHSALVTSTNVTLSWTTTSNDLFQVQWTTNLLGNIIWTPFPQTISSSSGTFTFTDTNAPATNKFYRLVWLPLP